MGVALVVVCSYLILNPRKWDYQWSVPRMTEAWGYLKNYGNRQPQHTNIGRHTDDR